MQLISPKCKFVSFEIKIRVVEAESAYGNCIRACFFHGCWVGLTLTLAVTQISNDKSLSYVSPTIFVVRPGLRLLLSLDSLRVSKAHFVYTNHRTQITMRRWLPPPFCVVQFQGVLSHHKRSYQYRRIKQLDSPSLALRQTVLATMFSNSISSRVAVYS